MRVRWDVRPGLILLVVAAAACGPTRQQVNANALRRDLSAMRGAIANYRRDKGHPPPALEDLVRAKYLRAIPADPLTGKLDWRVMIEWPVRVDEFQSGAATPSAGGVADVRSSAPGTDENGKAWSDY